jgi:Rrf2 family protein
MNLPRTVEFALHAAMQIAQADAGSPANISALVTGADIPDRYVGIILDRLTHHGILQASAHLDGSYVLAKEPESISLLELFEAVDGPMPDVVIVAKGLSAGVRSKVTQTLNAVAESTRSTLGALTLAHLVEDLPAEASPDERCDPLWLRDVEGRMRRR